jgi:hypothetical protein
VVDESASQRAKKDTLSGFGSIKFWLLDGLWTTLLTILVLFWTPPCITDGVYKIVYQVAVPFIGAISGLGVLYLVCLILAPYKQRDDARGDLAKAQKTIRDLTKKPKLALSMLYEVLAVFNDNSFDCRVYMKNNSSDTAKFAQVTISFTNIEIVNIIQGNCQRIDHLRKVPAIQWDYSGHAVHSKQTLKILDLKLIIKHMNQASFINTEMRAENINRIDEIHTIPIEEIENIKSVIGLGEPIMLEKFDPSKRAK